jgi:hypothetical protein
MSHRTVRTVRTVLASLLVVGALGLVGVDAASARPDTPLTDAPLRGVPAAAVSAGAAAQGQDFRLMQTAVSPLAELRREARTAARIGAPVVHHVYASVVAVTDTTSDDARTAEDLTQAEVAAAVQELSDYYLEESGGRIAFDLAGYETRSWGKGDCQRAQGLDWAQELSFDGAAQDPAWRAADNHVWALTLEGSDVCGGGIATLPGNVVFQNEGVVDVPDPEPGARAGIAVMLHEVGHNLGFGHADAGMCRSATAYDAPLGSWWDGGEKPDTLCPYLEYGDWQDIMGFSEVDQRMHVSALQRYLSGWLGGDVLRPGLGATSVLLHPLDDASGVRAVPVTDPRTGELYVVEYRTDAGNDATSQEFTSPLRDADQALFYLYPALAGSNGDTFARWAIDTPRETGGVRVLRLLYGTDDPLRHDPAYPYFRESLALAVGTSTYYPDPYNRNAHLDAGESFTSYSGGIRVSASSLDPVAGAQLVVPTRRAPSTTALTLSRTALTPRDAPQLTVSVRAPTASAVTGSVVARVDGRAVRTVVLPGTRGTVTFRIPAIRSRGRHLVSVSYRGSSRAEPSASRSVRVTVR